MKPKFSFLEPVKITEGFYQDAIGKPIGVKLSKVVRDATQVETFIYNIQITIYGDNDNDVLRLNIDIPEFALTTV